MEEPLVSIIVPVYNGERTIERCLRSIQNQSYRNIEIIVIDDGSMDHTGKVIEKYAAKDERFKHIRKVNSVPSVCRR